MVHAKTKFTLIHHIMCIIHTKAEMAGQFGHFKPIGIAHEENRETNRNGMR